MPLFQAAGLMKDWCPRKGDPSPRKGTVPHERPQSLRRMRQALQVLYCEAHQPERVEQQTPAAHGHLGWHARRHRDPEWVEGRVAEALEVLAR